MERCRRADFIFTRHYLFCRYTDDLYESTTADVMEISIVVYIAELEQCVRKRMDDKLALRVERHHRPFGVSIADNVEKMLVDNTIPEDTDITLHRVCNSHGGAQGVRSQPRSPLPARDYY